MRLAALLGLFLLAAPASAQAFLPAKGPWTREHRLVGSAPDGRIFAAVGARLAETRDGGLTWTVLTETSAPARLAADGPSLFGAFADGVRRSDDGGQTWTPWGLDGLRVLDIASDAGRVVAATYLPGASATEAYRRLPGGDWARLPVPSAGGAWVGTVAVRGDVVALGGERTSTRCPYVRQGIVLRSVDGGQTWDAAEAGAFTPRVAVSAAETVWSANSGADVCFIQVPPGFAPAAYRWAADAPAPILDRATRGGLALGPDGEPVELPDDGAPVQLSALEAAGGWVVGESIGTSIDCGIDSCTNTSPSGLYAARGGRTMSVGFEASPVKALAVLRDTLLAAADGAVFGVGLGETSADRWTNRLPRGRIGSLIPLGEAVLALSDGFTSFGGAEGGWVGTPPDTLQGLPNQFHAQSWAKAFGRTYVATPGSGQPWPCSVFLLGGWTEELGFDGIGTVASAGGSLFAGVRAASDGPEAASCHHSQVPAPAVLLRLDAPGGAWTSDADGLAAASVFDVAQDPATGRLVAATDAGAFSRGSGEAWAADGLAGRTVRTLHPAAGALYAGTDAGLFRREAGGWASVGPEIAERVVYAIASGAADGEAWLAVGTDRGVWTTTPRFVDAEAPAGAVRLTLRVSPNPGPRRVAVSAPARVRVFDALGRIVADLGDVATEAAWPGADLPAGVYVVRAEGASGAAVVRVSVVR